MPSNPKSSTTNTLSCFLCKGPHRALDFPKREKLNSLFAEMEDHNVESETYKVNPLQLLNAIIMAPQPVQPRLMHVPIKINGNAVLAMMDTGVTNIFVVARMIDRLGLEIAPSEARIKVINFAAQLLGFQSG